MNDGGPMAANATKDELHHLVDLLDDGEVDEALDYVRWLLSDGDELSPEELELDRRGEEEIARGEYVTLSAIRFGRSKT
jgi:hypothetical protein